MKPLYYFKLNAETGELTRKEIKEYEEKNSTNYTYGNRHYYRWKNVCYMYCYDNDLDRFKHNHLYSFNGDYDRAYKIVHDALFEKVDEATKTYNKLMTLFNKVQFRGMKNDM